MSAAIDHKYTDEIVCPYCSYAHGDSWGWIASSLTREKLAESLLKGRFSRAAVPTPEWGSLSEEGKLMYYLQADAVLALMLEGVGEQVKSCVAMLSCRHEPQHLSPCAPHPPH